MNLLMPKYLWTQLYTIHLTLLNIVKAIWYMINYSTVYGKTFLEKKKKETRKLFWPLEGGIQQIRCSHPLFRKHFLSQAFSEQP